MSGAPRSGVHAPPQHAETSKRQNTAVQFPADSVIVSGGAPGPDTWAEEAARKHGVAVQTFKGPGLRGK